VRTRPPLIQRIGRLSRAGRGTGPSGRDPQQIPDAVLVRRSAFSAKRPLTRLCARCSR